MRVYLDTNFFIAALEGSPELASSCQFLLAAGARRPGSLVTSQLTLAEVLVGPFRARSGPSGLSREGGKLVLAPATLAVEYGDLISDGPGLAVVAVDRDVLVLAAFRRANERTIRLPDAIHLATAEQAGCDHVVSGDRGIRPSTDYRFERIDISPEPLRLLTERLS